MKKVLIITYYWPPAGGAGVQRWLKLCKYLVQLDIQPIVLTVDPQFATYPQIDYSLSADVADKIIVHHSKSFELYSVYKKVSSNKEVPFGGFANTGKVSFKEKILRFVRGNFFVPDPRRGWNKYALKEAKTLIDQYNIDTVITTSPPHSTQLIGLKLKRMLNIRWIVDLRDPWTDIYYYKQLYPTRLVTNINKKLERKILTNADEVITVSDDLKRLFAEKTKEQASKISVIPNGFDTSDFQHIDKTVNKDFFYISYVGTISEDYNSKAFITALKNVPDEIITRIRIRFVGKVNPKTLNDFENAGLGNYLELHDYVPHHKAIEFMISSRMLLLIIPDVKNNEGILTGKLFEYLACGRPIVFIGPVNGDAARIIHETGSGIVCGYTDDKKITAAILKEIGSEPGSSIGIENEKVMQYSREYQAGELARIIKTTRK